VSPYITADLIISGVMIIVGISFIVTGINQKKKGALKPNFMSPNTAIFIGALLVLFQLAELVEKYLVLT